MSLSHYCSNEAFHSIISNKEIRLSSLSMSNDSDEGQLIHSTLLSIAQEHKLNNDELKLFEETLDFFGIMFDALGFCLSEKEDLLSQWRGYADDGQGVSIVFSEKYLRSLSDFSMENTEEQKGIGRFIIKQVIYDPDEQKSALEPTFRHIRKHFDGEISGVKKGVVAALNPLLSTAYALKNKAFAEEVEWRLIALYSNIYDKDLGNSSYHFHKKRIKPFRAFELADLNDNPIERIILGPKNISNKDVIDSFLKQNNFKDVEVRKSLIPYV